MVREGKQAARVACGVAGMMTSAFFRRARTRARCKPAMSPSSAVIHRAAEPHVERDLVIARAGGVQLRAGRNALGQLGLDVHVDVFEFGLPQELRGGDFLADLCFKPWVIALNSFSFSTPIFWSIVAWAMEPADGRVSTGASRRKWIR